MPVLVLIWGLLVLRSMQRVRLLPQVSLTKNLARIVLSQRTKPLTMSVPERGLIQLFIMTRLFRQERR